MLKLFGFQYDDKEWSRSEKKKGESFVPETTNDGSVVIDGSGHFNTYLDLTYEFKDEYQLINRYKDMAMHPKVDIAIDDIVNEAIVSDEAESPVSINLDKLPKEYSDKTKKLIEEEFKNCLRLLNFNEDCYEIFRNWYVDGRLYYHKVIDTNPKNGIIELRYIDPRQIRKFKEIRKSPSTNKNDGYAEIIETVNEYYVYNPRGVVTNQSVGMKISPDAICYCHSGLLDKSARGIISYLHKAIKPVNQLRMTEDAMIIYRLSRAPERRLFYIDTGQLPKNMAEQYVQNLINKYRNKLVYDATTGETRGDKRYMSMMEDIWLPRREGSQGTSIETLPGAQNLSDIEDVLFFQKNVYEALNVPKTRLNSDTGFNIGRATEITRDELKFTRFVNRLRKRFNHLFNDLLETQLVCKRMCSREDWQDLKEFIHYTYVSNSYFTELKDSEILRDRISLLNTMGVQQVEGVYYSKEFIRKRVLRLTEEEVREIEEQIKGEKSKYSEVEKEQENTTSSNLETLDIEDEDTETDIEKELDNEERKD